MLNIILIMIQIKQGIGCKNFRLFFSSQSFTCIYCLNVTEWASVPFQAGEITSVLSNSVIRHSVVHSSYWLLVSYVGAGQIERKEVVYKCKPSVSSVVWEDLYAKSYHPNPWIRNLYSLSNTFFPCVLSLTLLSSLKAQILQFYFIMPDGIKIKLGTWTIQKLEECAWSYLPELSQLFVWTVNWCMRKLSLHCE